MIVFLKSWEEQLNLKIKCNIVAITNMGVYSETQRVFAGNGN
jgi:hypothetical protein